MVHRWHRSALHSTNSPLHYLYPRLDRQWQTKIHLQTYRRRISREFENAPVPMSETTAQHSQTSELPHNMPWVHRLDLARIKAKHRTLEQHAPKAAKGKYTMEKQQRKLQRRQRKEQLHRCNRTRKYKGTGYKGHQHVSQDIMATTATTKEKVKDTAKTFAMVVDNQDTPHSTATAESQRTTVAQKISSTAQLEFEHVVLSSFTTAHEIDIIYYISSRKKLLKRQLVHL